MPRRFHAPAATQRRASCFGATRIVRRVLERRTGLPPSVSAWSSSAQSLLPRSRLRRGSASGRLSRPLASPRASDPVPVVRMSEMRLARAKALYESGRLHDALRALEAIDRGDPLRRDADTLVGVDSERAPRHVAHRTSRRGGRPMKCPKCDYLGFETGDRCKNCGYDFSLACRLGSARSGSAAARTGVEPSRRRPLAESARGAARLGPAGDDVVNRVRSVGGDVAGLHPPAVPQRHRACARAGAGDSR